MTELSRRSGGDRERSRPGELSTFDRGIDGGDAGGGPRNVREACRKVAQMISVTETAVEFGFAIVIV